ncbi:hypothetical protein ACFV2B_29855 [Streptomyces lavendulae]|uniref:hypothetical protein n=1 Tax=Streptomyces lavendulae TaxID=1914 RepID=UPI0036C9FEEF
MLTGRSVGEEEFEVHAPALRLPELVIAVTFVAHRELPGEGQCGAIVVPAPPPPLHDESIAVIFCGLDPVDLHLDELLERRPGPRDVVDRVRVQSVTSEDLREQLGAVLPVGGHAGC